MAIPTPIKASGSHFYRYARLERAEHLEWLNVIMLKHALYLPNLTELNDPSDGRPKLVALSIPQMVLFLQEMWCEGHPKASYAEMEHSRQVLIYNLPKFGKDRCLRKLSQSLNEQLENYRIYSMTKRYDNPSMWAKYAADHSGYCLEFANVGPLFAHALEVIYGNTVEMDVTNPDHRTGYWFYCKRQDWSNEEEVRIIVPRNQGTTVKIDPPWLTRVILGRRIKQENRVLIRQWAKQRVPEVSVVDAYYDELDQTVKIADVASATASRATAPRHAGRIVRRCLFGTTGCVPLSPA